MWHGQKVPPKLGAQGFALSPCRKKTDPRPSRTIDKVTTHGPVMNKNLGPPNRTSELTDRPTTRDLITSANPKCNTKKSALIDSLFSLTFRIYLRTKGIQRLLPRSCALAGSTSTSALASTSSMFARVAFSSTSTLRQRSRGPSPR